MGLGLPLYIALGLIGAGAGSNAAPVPASFLYQPAYCIDDVWRGPAVAYVPQPGDVLLATDCNRFWALTHNLAFAFEPHNSALIVQRCDGSLGVLEAGPNDTTRCRILPLLEHLKEYADKGPVWIRKRKTPLTCEQNAALTAFAERQNGKLFALVRLAGQLTPLRSRGPLRTYCMGKPHGDRCGYYCAELVCESLVACGALDPHTTRPCATYPHDLFFDQSYNLYISHHLPLVCDWYPPARWLDHP